MTEEQRERAAEAAQDRLDKRFLGSEMTQEDYDLKCKAIAAYAEGKISHQQMEGKLFSC